METHFEGIEQNTGPSKEKLLSDLRILARDAEDLLKATAEDVSDKLTDRAKEARGRLAETLEKAKATCQRLEAQTIATAKAADKVIRDHPYQAIGISFGLGLLIGVLVNRK